MGGKKPKRGFSGRHIILLMCVFALAGLYLFEANSIVKERFELESVRSQIQEVRGKSDKIETEASETKALHKLEFLSEKLNLEEVGRVSYIEVRASSPLVLGNQ